MKSLFGAISPNRESSERADEQIREKRETSESDNPCFRERFCYAPWSRQILTARRDVEVRVGGEPRPDMTEE